MFNDVGAASTALTVAIFPLFGIRRNRDVCARVGGQWVRGNLWRLRNPKLPPRKLFAAKKLFRDSALLDGPHPEHREQWIPIFEQFELDNTC